MVESPISQIVIFFFGGREKAEEVRRKIKSSDLVFIGIIILVVAIKTIQAQNRMHKAIHAILFTNTLTSYLFTSHSILIFGSTYNLSEIAFIYISIFV